MLNTLFDVDNAHSFEGGFGGSPPNTLLDYSVHKSPFPSYSKRQKRLFHRALSGCEVAQGLKEKVRFLHLTSASVDLNNKIHRDFEVFVKRVKREFGKFEYCAVREYTKSGLSHVHLLYRGSYMPQKWLSEAWSNVHGSPIVFVEMVRFNSKRVAGYLTKYLSKDLMNNYRFWCSQGWVFRGFVRMWENLKRCKGRVEALRLWKLFLNFRNALEFEVYVFNGEWHERVIQVFRMRERRVISLVEKPLF
jgi:hypothetical protein